MLDDAFKAVSYRTMGGGKSAPLSNSGCRRIFTWPSKHGKLDLRICVKTITLESTFTAHLGIIV